MEPIRVMCHSILHVARDLNIPTIKTANQTSYESKYMYFKRSKFIVATFLTLYSRIIIHGFLLQKVLYKNFTNDTSVDVYSTEYYSHKVEM